MNVLLSSAGRRVSLARAFQTELSQLGLGGRLIATDLNPNLSAACQVADLSVSVPRTDDPEFLDRLLEVCLQHEISLVIPTIDTELLLLAQSRARFADHGIFVSVPEPEFVGICRDKRLTAGFLEERGIRAPRMISKNDPRFPLFIKPYDGSLSKDTYAIASADELTEYHFRNEKLIFMEYISPHEYDEFTVDMYYSENRLVCAVPRLRMEVRAGEISKGRTVKGALLHSLVERIGTVPGARGCLTAQFFVHRATQEPVGIEINPRFGGGFPLSYAAGANYPRWLIHECLREAPPTYWDGWEDGLLMLRYDEEVIVHDSRSQ